MRIKLEQIGFKGQLLDSQALEKELFKAVDKTTKAAQKDFKKTTRTWETEVVFLVSLARKKGDNIEGSVTTTNDVYRYVTRGTKPHVIRPKNAGILRFRSGYRAKTKPGFLGSSRGGESGEAVFSDEVHHPGTEARRFEEEISARHQTTLEDNALAAMKRAARRRRT